MEEFTFSRPGGKVNRGKADGGWLSKMRGWHAVPALAGFPSKKKKSDRENSKMPVFIPQPYSL